jgi:hypothetical protein
MNKRDALDLANLNSRMKILIIKPSSLGDVIHSLRVVSVMRKKLAGLRFTGSSGKAWSKSLKLVASLTDISSSREGRGQGNSSS